MIGIRSFLIPAISTQLAKEARTNITNYLEFAPLCRIKTQYQAREQNRIIDAVGLHGERVPMFV